jgi:hypothetical protein
MNAKELKSQPVGTRVIDVSDFVWTKTDDGRWFNEVLAESNTDAGVAHYGVDLYIDLELEDWLKTTTL